MNTHTHTHRQSLPVSISLMYRPTLAEEYNRCNRISLSESNKLSKKVLIIHLCGIYSWKTTPFNTHLSQPNPVTLAINVGKRLLSFKKEAVLTFSSKQSPVDGRPFRKPIGILLLLLLLSKRSCQSWRWLFYCWVFSAKHIIVGLLIPQKAGIRPCTLYSFTPYIEI